MDRATQPIDDSRVKLCTVCGVVTSRAGSRCTNHARQSNRSRHNALYSTRAWQRLSARVLRAWRGEHGDWCPGYVREAHPAIDLTADHVVPLAAEARRSTAAILLCSADRVTRLRVREKRTGGTHTWVLPSWKTAPSLCVHAAEFRE
jgi:5-methylcytosine-specific restriction enzyme A